ncbi:MAG TPA: hypothetical protein VGC55_08765 [Dokdonella sp.]
MSGSGEKTPLLACAARLVGDLSRLSGGEHLDDLIAMNLLRFLDGRYELTGAGAALKAGLAEIIAEATSARTAEHRLAALVRNLHAIGRDQSIDAHASLQLEHMALVRRTQDHDTLTPLGKVMMQRLGEATQVASTISPEWQARLAPHAAQAQPDAPRSP